MIAILGALLLSSTTAVYAHGSNGNGKWKWHNGDYFRTSLRGSNEVPAVTSTAKAAFSIWVNDAHDRAPFTFHIKRASDVTMAHLHCAAVGQNGPVVVTLLGETPGGLDLKHEIIRSSLENDNINTTNGATCPTPITNLETLETAMENGQVYVNVHTVTNPGGEMRGQLQ